MTIADYGATAESRAKGIEELKVQLPEFSNNQLNAKQEMKAHEKRLLIEWRTTAIRSLTPEEQTNVPLSKRDKTVIEHHGLPVEVEPLFTTNVGGEHGLFSAFKMQNNKHLTVIGSDYRTLVCVDQETAEVWSICESGRYPNRFINSSMESFLLFLSKVSNFRLDVRELDDETAQRFLDDVTTELRLADLPAMAHVDNWWPTVLEQVSNGLL